MDNDIILIKPFLTNEQQDIFLRSVENYEWKFFHNSVDASDTHVRNFWIKDIITSNVPNIFREAITKITGTNIQETERMYLNGQANNQCGYWHRDTKEEDNNSYTCVYFGYPWKPEYGGHLLVKDPTGQIHSFLPEENTAIIFNSNWLHMALSPSVHCTTQRVSCAFKFKV